MSEILKPRVDRTENNLSYLINSGIESTGCIIIYKRLG